MLATLRIKNLALAEDLTIDFEPGLTVITGETGAGKSILIGAAKLALGDRADRGQIRAGADQCTVEAVFSIPSSHAEIREFLASKDLELNGEGELFLKRTISTTGTNRQFVNGSPVPLQTLAGLGELLVDLHGPHDHQSLLHSSCQRDILDAFGNLRALRGAFAALCVRHGELDEQKAALQGDEMALARQSELLRFQVAEIQGARLSPEEETTLETAHTRAANAAKAMELGQSTLSLLADDDNSALTQAAQITRSLQELVRVDPEAAEWLALQEQSVQTLQELQIGLRRFVEKIDLSPDRLLEIEERFALVQSLKRKYGRTIAEILAFGSDASEKLGLLDSRIETLAGLESGQARLREQLWQAGRELSRKRRALIPGLVKATVAELRDLGFKDCRFDVTLTTAEDPARAIWNDSSGIDQVEFMFAPNVGEPPRPLRSIASSGEMARVMLALKTALADQDRVPVLIFDEIDANVGGETSVKVGEKMAQIAKRRQVLCITHLPAVAAAARQHLLVTKKVTANRTITEVTSLVAEARVDEVARMLGGRSRAALDHAQTLLQKP